MGVILVYGIFIVACVGALLRPHYGIYGYIAFVSLCPQWLWRFSLHDPDFAFQKYIAGATIVGYLLSEFRGQRLIGRTRRAIQFGMVFLVLSYASSFQTIAPQATAFFLGTMWKIMLMLYLTVRLIDTPEKTRTALWIVLICVGWNAWELNIDYLKRGYSLVNLPGEEWALMNANAYSLILLLVAVLSFAMAVTANNVIPSLIAAAIGLLCLHAIYILEARGAMLGLIFSAGIFLIFMPKKTSSILRVGVAFAVALILAGPSVVQEFASSFEAAEIQDVSAASRFYIWDAGLRICIDYPLLGVGPWAGEWLVPDYYQFEVDQLRLPTKALHNLTLEIATGSGIPALVAYSAMFLLPLLSLRIAIRRSVSPILRTVAVGSLAAIPGYWVASQFNSGGLIEVPYVVLGLALTVANQCDWNRSETLPEDQNEAVPVISKSSIEFCHA